MRNVYKLVSVVLILCAVLCLGGCGNDSPSDELLSDLVADAILNDESNSYYEGECFAEGHKVLGSSLSDNTLKVYALTMTGNYGFYNDMFIKISGSGVIPAVLTFEISEDDYKLKDIEYPMDGEYYTKSIEKMFPLQYHPQVLTVSNSDREDLIALERSYAETYLNSIGREAKIGEYGDLNVVLLTDRGISVNVSNKLLNDMRICSYPYWIGSSETLEDGVRYVRSLSLNESANEIIYETVEKMSGTVTEKYIYDASTGDLIS